MPRKTNLPKRSTHSRVEEARELLLRARAAVLLLNSDAVRDAQNKRRSAISRTHAGRRFRMTGSICSTIESLRELLWEMPGVDYKQTYRKK